MVKKLKGNADFLAQTKPGYIHENVYEKEEYLPNVIKVINFQNKRTDPPKKILKKLVKPLPDYRI
jgi:hypothetical protein